MIRGQRAIQLGMMIFATRFYQPESFSTEYKQIKAPFWSCMVLNWHLMSLEAFLHSSIYIEHSFNIIICSNTWICREIHAKADSMFFFFEEVRFHSSWSSWANSEYIDIVFIRFAMNIGISSLRSVPNLKVSKIQNTHFFCWKYLFNKN